MKRIIIAYLLCNLVFALSAGAQTQKTITMESLLGETFDLNRLTYFPEPYYINKQSSSYDRATKSREEGWFANNDRGHYLGIDKKEDREEKILLDAEGPGVVTRIWSANANEGGMMRIYIDGADQPVLEESMEKILGGTSDDFKPPIAGVRAKGWNLYYPIPYQKHCKITIDGGSIYYHVNYKTYPKNVKIESFSMEKVRNLSKHNDRVIEIFKDPEAAFKVEGTKKLGEFDIPAGKTVVIHETTSQIAGSIKELRIKVVAKNLDDALRGCVLIGEFDNEQKPLIWSPVGDFFGSAPDINPYNSLPLTVREDGVMISRWEMPFRRSTRLSIMNTTIDDMKIGIYALVSPYNWTNRSMYFNAKWVKDTIDTEPKSDWNFTTIRGAGVFVGGALHVLNPLVNWWGEGDEKIFIDGEEFPSHFGTGTEDYYGYAWCSNEKFYHAYHNQPRCDGPRNKGNTSVNRFHILDDIPFRRSFKFDMEIWHWKKCNITYAAISYWYAQPGATDVFTVPPTSKLTVE